MSDVARGEVPVLECFKDAYRFLRANIVLFIPAATIPALAAGLGEFFNAAPSTNPANAPSGLSMLAFGLLGVVANVMFIAAVLRKAVRDEVRGPLAITFGADEIRLLAVAAALLLMIGPFLLLILVVSSIVVLGRVALNVADIEKTFSDPDAFSKALVDSLGPGGALLFMLFCMALMVGYVWFNIRLSLVNPAVIGERRIVIFQTWSWSYGNFWRIVAAMVLTSLPIMFVGTIVSGIFVQGFYGGDVERYAALSAPVRFVSGTIQGFIGVLISIPSLALSAQLYKGLRPPEFQPK